MSGQAWVAAPYTEALRDGHGPLFLRGRDGWSVPLDVERWCATADSVDMTLLRRCRGRVLDIGCGPGRLVTALGGLGHATLGIDINPAAVARTLQRGGRALRRSVFDELPGAGLWDTALLVDGNLGIGGDPGNLLRRVAQIVGPGGRLLAEVACHDVDERLHVWMDDGRGGLGTSFPWARIGITALRAQVAATDWLFDEEWTSGGREFVALRRRHGEADGTCEDADGGGGEG